MRPGDAIDRRDTIFAVGGQDVRFGFLGGTKVSGPAGTIEVRGAQPALVLGRLVLEFPRPLLRADLVALVWGDGGDPASGAVRQVLARARIPVSAAGAGPMPVVSSAGSVRLAMESARSDAGDALDAVGAAATALEAGNPAEAWAWACAAVDAAALPLLPGCEGRWVERWRARLSTCAQRARKLASAAAVADGRPDDGVATAVAALAEDPLDEHATRLLMAAHAATGGRAAALAAYERCRHDLDELLGVRPSEATEAAYLDLLGAAPEPRRTPPPRAQRRWDSDGETEFAGRHGELATLVELWRAASDGHLVAASLEGEAGIGKTRLAAELAALAAAEGALVLWGRCQAAAATPLQPVDDLVDQLLDAVREPGGGDPAGLGTDGGRLVRRLGRLLDAAARPAVVVIDDVHRAPEATVGLLEDMSWTLAGRPCLVLFTARTVEGPLAEMFHDLQRRGRLTPVALGGLGTGDIGRLLDGRGIHAAGAGLAGVGSAGVGGAEAGGDGTAALAAAVLARTAGNPLYVTQMIGAADADGTLDPAALPGAVTALVARRVASLAAPLAATLELAAVADPRWSWSTLDACSSLDSAELLDALEELCRQRLLDEVGVGVYAFVHDVVRDAVLIGIGPARTALLHARLGRVLIEAAAEPVVVAHHLVAAGTAAEVDPTPWLLAAGDGALASGAWADALGHYGLAGEHARTPAERCRALTGEGRAHHGAGAFGLARRTLDQAVGLAGAFGLAAELAAATVALVGGGGRGVAVEMADADREALLRRALDGLDGLDIGGAPAPVGADPGYPGSVGHGQAGLRIAVLGELALSLVLTDRRDECAALCDRTVAEARASADADAVTRALHTRRCALMGPAGTVRRAADASDAVAVGAGMGSVVPANRIAARLDLVEDLLELGDQRGAEVVLAEAEDLADRFDHPYWRWAATSWRALLAVVDGRLDDAEALALAAFGHQPADHPEAVAALGVQLVCIRLLQGQAGEVVEGLATAAAESPHIPCYRAVLALCLLRAGRTGEGRAVFDDFARLDFALPADSNWLLGTTVLADCAATLGDADGAAHLAEVLRPWSGRNAVLNCYGAGGAWWGPVGHQLERLDGLVASVLAPS